MFTITKDGIIATVSNPSSLPAYIANGWKLVADKTESVAEEAVPELTKKELQAKLDGLGIAYKPTDNKATLLGKINSAEPDDFDDGLLKG